VVAKQPERPVLNISFLNISKPAGAERQRNKSIRAGQISLAESYIRVDENSGWLIEAHIAPYVQANRFNHDPKRPRRLLLHSKEIREMWDAVRQKASPCADPRVSKSMAPKLEIAIAKGKKLQRQA